MEWISINEKLPEDFTFVLATLVAAGQSFEDQTWVEIVGYNCGSFELPARGKTSFVTHWMPIPQPAI